jgi:hypothetical protein
MYYVARWYDPHIAHFVQADTIVPGAGNPAAWNRYAYVMYNPLKYTDPSGHFSNEQLEEWFGTEDKDWRTVINESFSEEFINILMDDDVNLGDLITYEINGESFSGVFALNEDGNLVLWDMDQKLTMSLMSEVNPLTVYDNLGDGLFGLIINKTEEDYPQTLRFESNWQYGEDMFVQKREEITGWECGVLCVAGIGLEAIDITAAYHLSTGIPYIGHFSLLVAMIDGVQTEERYRVETYLGPVSSWPFPGYDN